MKSKKDFAAIWQKEMSKQDEPTVEMTFDGLSGEFRRLPIQGWIKAGKVPQFLVKAMLEVRGEPAPDTQPRIPTYEEMQADLKFQQEAVCFVGVNPVFVAEDRPLKEGEISYKELAEKRSKVIDEIVMWVMQGCPDVPIRLNDGSEVAMTDVVNFRKEPKGRATAKSRADVQGKSATA